MGNPLTAYVVLGIGNLLGGVTKGVTGFGSAILNLCTWIAFVVTGVQSGTLQQAVVCEALASTFIAPVLLYITRAHRTADFKMVSAISLFVALSSPVGAAILAKLDSKTVELVMGAALLLIIVAEQVSKAVLSYKQRAYLDKVTTCEDHHSVALTACADSRCWAQDDDIGTEPLLNDRRQQQQQQQHQRQEQQQQQQQQQQQWGQEQTRLLDSDPSSYEDCMVCLSSDASIPGISTVKEHHRMAASSSDASCSHVPSQHIRRTEVGPVADACGQHGAVTVHLGPASAAAAMSNPCDILTSRAEEQQGLLIASSSSSSTGQALAANTSDASSSSSSSSVAGVPELVDVSSQGLRWPSIKSWLVVFGVCSVAGTLSGIMEGLTGMNGPPIMFMYRRLNTPKATVRGNNAFLNLLQMRLVPYWYMGLIVSRDLPLYGVSCAAGAIGVLVGDRLSHRIEQQAFQQVLGVLMMLCCLLMFASGLGFVA